MLNASILRSPLLLPLLLCATLALSLGFLVSTTAYEWQGLFIVAAILGIICAFMLPRFARAESGHFLLKVLIAGLLLKFIFALVRQWMALDVYAGAADITEYHSWGLSISQHIWQFEFDQLAPFLCHPA